MKGDPKLANESRAQDQIVNNIFSVARKEDSGWENASPVGGERAGICLSLITHQSEAEDDENLRDLKREGETDPIHGTTASQIAKGVGN